jgi:hypothetical protein
MASGNCYPYLNRIMMLARRFLSVKSVSEQLLDDVHSRLERWQEDEKQRNTPKRRRRVEGKVQLPGIQEQLPRVVGGNVSRPSFNRNRQQDSMFRDERNSGVDDTPRDLHAAEPNSDGRNSTHRPVDRPLNNCCLPEIRSQLPYHISPEHNEVWQPQALGGEGTPRRADSTDMTLLNTEPPYDLPIESTSRHVPPPTPEKSTSGCSTCRRRRIKCDEKKPSCKSLLSCLVFNSSLIANAE